MTYRPIIDLFPLKGRFETHGRGFKDDFDRWAAAFKHPILARSAVPKNR